MRTYKANMVKVINTASANITIASNAFKRSIVYLQTSFYTSYTTKQLCGYYAPYNSLTNKD